MSEIRSNSDKSRAQKKEVTPVAKGEVRRKKKTEIQKFSDIFFAEDLGTIKEYIFRDVIMPALKSTLLSVVNNATEVALYGETSAPQRKIPGAKISYDKVGRFGDVQRRRDYNSIQRTAYDFGDAIVDSRAEADAALDALEATIEEYGQASVADLFDIIGVTPASTDYNYGWDSIATASAARLRDGRYLLRLPKARPLV